MKQRNNTYGDNEEMSEDSDKQKYEENNDISDKQIRKRMQSETSDK